MQKMKIGRDTGIIKEIIMFLSLAFGIPGACIILMKMIDNTTLSFVLYGIEGASPSLAAVFAILLQRKRVSLSSFLRAKYIENLNIVACILGIVAPLLILSFAKMISILLGDPFLTLVSLTPRKLVIIAWALIAEELGWRGYLQDKLEVLLPNAFIPFVSGIIWALWHYHFLLSGSMKIPLFAFLLGCIFESYGYFVITKYAKNNVVPACIWHFTGNLFFNMYRFDPHWHDGDISFYWITTVCYVINVFLFYLYEKQGKTPVLRKSQ